MTRVAGIANEDWEAVGREAFENGEPNVPTVNARVRVAIAGLPVGSGAADIFGAFSTSWDAANLENTDYRAGTRGHDGTGFAVSAPFTRRGDAEKWTTHLAMSYRIEKEDRG